MGLFHSKVGVQPLQQEPQESTASSTPEGNVTGGGPVAFQGARDTQINGGTFNVAENIHNVVNHFHPEVPPDNDLVSKILDWLSPDVNFRSIQIETLNKRTPDTGKWLLEGGDFREWFDSAGGILWGIGIPGAGKTVVASIVIDFLETYAKGLDPWEMSVAYAYSRYTEPIAVEQILIGLASQQLRCYPSLVEFVEPLYRQHENGKTKPVQKELVDLLGRFSRVFTLSFYILDGIDEARKDVQFDLVQALRSIKAHFFLTSRPLESLKSRLPEAKIFRVVAHSDDITLLIAEIIERNPEFSLLLADKTLKQEVITKILEKSAGMFLHAALQLKALQECVNEDQIRSKLDELPAGLDGMYDVTISRIEKQSPERSALAKRILTLVVHAERPLEVEELQYAAAADLEAHTFRSGSIVQEEILLGVCCGLIYVEYRWDGWVRKTRRIVRLIHFTAKDALHQILLKYFPIPYAFFASTCISRLISCNFHESDINDKDQLDATFDMEPFLGYAYDYWHAYGRRCDPLSPASQCISQFLARCQSFPLCMQITGDQLYYGCVARGAGIHVASSFGLLHALSNVPDPNMPTLDHHLTPLLLALRFSPLISSTNGAMDLLNLPGIAVNAADTRWGYTPLVLASIFGYAGVVGRLLEFHDIEINARGKDETTALMYAARQGHSGIVNLLLQQGTIDVNFSDKRGRTALMLALMDGKSDVVGQLFLHPQIDVNRRDEEHRTALMLAFIWGTSGMVGQLLLHPRVDVNGRDEHGRMALMLAAEMGRLDIVRQLLLHRNIDVNGRDKYGRTALRLASMESHLLDIFRQLLLHPRTDVNATDHYGRTLLTLASIEGQVDVVGQLLLHPGIDVNSRDEHGRTALMWASKDGGSDIVGQLLQCAGINVNATDNYGYTVLMVASEDGRLAVVETLLHFPGIQPGLANRYGDTALLLAESGEGDDHPTIARLIREALAKQTQSTDA